MSDLKKLVAQFMSELAKFEATTAQEPIAADEFSSEELADLTKIRNMGAKIRTKMAAAAKPNTEIPKLEAVPFPQPEEMPQMTEAGNDETRTKGGGGKTKPKKEEQNNDAPATSATCFVYEKITWKLNIEGCVPETIIYEASSKIKETVTVKLGEEEPKIWKKLLPYNSLLYKSDGSNTGTISAQIVGKSKDGSVHAYTEVFEIPNADKCYDLTVEVRWFGDGEKEFPIMINGKTDDDKGKPSYWSVSLLEEIYDETGADFSKEHTQSAEFVDGDMGFFPAERTKQGKLKAAKDAFGIFDKLKRDPNTGKIVQKIQIYTHSRGSAFGNGYLDELKHQIEIYHKKHNDIFADVSHVVDIVLDMDAHQSPYIHKKKANHPNIAIAHGNGIADANETGDVLGIDRYAPHAYWETAESKIPSHGNGTFSHEVDAILDQHNRNEFSQNPDKYEGFDKIFHDAEIQKPKE
jgi:hypothetical protein